MLSKLEEIGSEQIKKRARKVLVYGMIVIIIVLAVIATVNFARGWVLQKRLEKLHEQMAIVHEANKTLSDSVESIRRLRELDSQVLNQMTERLGDQLKRDAQLKSQLEILETTNASARDYLDTPIHRDVARLLDESSNGESTPPASEEPSGQMRPSSD